MEIQKLEFTDGRRIDVNAIYGGPRLINGAMRDTLQIEIDPSNINFNSLKALFSDTKNLETLSSITIISGCSNEDKTEIGTGYNILVSITDENRSIEPEPGSMEPYSIKEVYVVTIAQETYAEHQLRIINEKLL